MKAKFNYKSKKTIIIAIIVLALIVITGIGIGLFLKGNNDAEAVGNNTVGNTIDNNANKNTPSNNQTGSADNNAGNNENADNTANDGENANNNENVENGDNANNGENDENTDNNANNGANNNQNQGNANNGNNVTMQEFVTERVEVIPERVIAENYWVTWEPTKFETLVSGEISLEKANIVAEKAVAKLTANGLEQNPESVKVGEILQYSITLTNANLKINGLVNVTDEIPAGTEFVFATETNLKTTPTEYENASEVTKLEWKNVKVEAGSEVTLLVYVKVVAKAENEDTTSVQNTAKIYDGTTPEEDVPSPETKVANITCEKTSKVIYNEQKTHEHIVVNGIEPLHEQDIIEYTITLTNVGEATGTIKVSDTVPEGTTLIKDGVVTVVDQVGTTKYEIDELVEGIDVTVAAATEEAAGVATVTFRVIVNSFDAETKQIVNDMAKVDGEPTNETEDEAEKVYIDIPVTKVWENIGNDAAQVYSVDSIKFQVKNGETVVAEKVVALEAHSENGIAGGWKYTFENLPKYDANGNEINYTVVESATNATEQEILDTYYNANTVTERNLASTNVVITNTFNPSKLTDTVNVPASKVWLNTESDAAKAYAIDSIKLQLFANGEFEKEQVVAETADEENIIVGGWSYTFANLPKYDAQGEIIEYTVGEVAVNEADKAKLDKYTVSIDQETGIITNTFNLSKVKDETTQVTITKVWEDNLNAYNTRPDSVTLTLSNGTNYTLTGDKNAYTWTQIINNLPKYDANGNIINYTVTEANVPAGYTKVSESELTVTNKANVIVEKSAYKANEDGTIGSEVTASDVFKADDTVYYKLTFKNAGNTVIDTKTLTDILPLRLELVAIDGIEVTDSTTNGTDSNGYTWTLSTNAEGNTVINWTLTEVEAGATKKLTIKAKVVAEAEYKDLCQKAGETTLYEAKLFVRKDGEVPYEGSGTSHGIENYTNSLGTVYLTSSELFYDTEANLKNDDLYYLIKNNNKITDMISKGITRAELEDALADNGITLATDEVVVWYVIKLEEGYHIDGVIRKISDLTSINNAVYMDNVKQDDVTIDLEDIEIGQRGTVTVNVTSTTTANVSTPMDVVFVIDTSGSMKGTNATNMVNAVNTSIKTIMEKSPDTRIGVVGFSGDSSTIIPLSNYGKDKDYLSLSNNTISPTSTITGYSRKITGGTNTQAGIKAGAEMLTSQSTTTFTTTVNGVTVTGTRTPVLILVTDGEPTYYYEEETATGTRSGNGSEKNTDENYYYWTIRTAKYYKNAITIKYYAGTTKQAKVFTIGIGMSGNSATTMLNPNQTNVDACKNSNDNSEAKRLYNLLNENQTPYAYSYADASKTGELTESDIESFLTSSLTASSESMVVRAITAEESKTRRINLTSIDTSKDFSLEIIGEETLSYSSLSAAQTAGYVKLDSKINTYYVDLSSITRDATVNINYWEQ